MDLGARDRRSLMGEEDEDDVLRERDNEMRCAGSFGRRQRHGRGGNDLARRSILFSILIKMSWNRQ